MVYLTTMAMGTDTNSIVILTVVVFILLVAAFLVCVKKHYSKQGLYEDENHALVSLVEHSGHSHTNMYATNNSSDVRQEPDSKSTKVKMYVG